MAKIFENSHLVNKLAFDDPECAYVNRMMEMSADTLRELNKKGESYDSLHGVVPTCKLPIGYYFGNIKSKSVDEVKQEKDFNKKSSNYSNIVGTKDSEEHDNDMSHVDETDIMIQTVRDDLILSEEDEEPENDVSTNITNNIDRPEDSEKLLFDTLNACCQKLPNLSPLDRLQKHFRVTRNIQIKNTPNELSTRNVDSETKSATPKLCQQNIQELLDLIATGTYKKNMSDSFQDICNIVKNNKKRKLSPLLKAAQEAVTPPKVSKPSLPKVEEKKPDIQEAPLITHSLTDICELHMNVNPKIMEALNSEKLRRLMESSKESNFVKPKYETQDSLPFKIDSLQTKPNKAAEVIPTPVTSSQPSIDPSNTTDSTQNPVKKPEATAKQFYVKPTNYSNYNNNAKVAVVTGKVNETKPSLQNKIDSGSNNKSSTNQNSACQRSTNQNRPQAFKDSNDNYADEAKVVEGLMAMKRMRTYFKSDFISRMKQLDIDQWLKEVRSLKEKAVQSKGRLEYAPYIMIFIRKNLFYNYSLEVKNDFAKSHHTYLENATIIKQSCAEIYHIFTEHEKNISDKTSTRLWNINLLKHFTVAMCHHLSAILQYRAFSNVADDCRKTYHTLLRLGVVDKSDRANPLLTTTVAGEGVQQHSGSSPFSALSSAYSTGSPHAGMPLPGNGGGGIVTLTPEARLHLQRYVDQTRIINTGYSDWLTAEQGARRYCGRSVRHEEAWRDFEWHIVERTGGVALATIDESVPFVIKYLEGYINYVNEFMKRHL